jgi:hypothetical protein
MHISKTYTLISSLLTVQNASPTFIPRPKVPTVVSCRRLSPVCHYIKIQWYQNIAKLVVFKYPVHLSASGHSKSLKIRIFCRFQTRTFSSKLICTYYVIYSRLHAIEIEYSLEIMYLLTYLPMQQFKYLQ